MAASTARNVMTDSVVTVSPESNLLDVLRLFVEEDIHGAPVVDEAGQAIGMISTSDLLRAQNEEQDSISTETHYLRAFLDFSAPDGASDLVDFQDRLAQRRVDEVMTKGLISVSPDAPVAEVARSLRENQVHRVWVEEGGRLCGVVSTLDLMPVIERASNPQ